MHRSFFFQAAAVATLALGAGLAPAAAGAQTLNFNGSANLGNQPGSTASTCSSTSSTAPPSPT
jgi:hypothetical protein